jgi:glycosyltransferase involved in cell wall biosynthesis
VNARRKGYPLFHNPDLPLVSIVTPSFNQADYLEETILSVLEQDYENLEYIVVDGGSTDGSIEIIQQYASQITSWVSETDMGQTDAINKGFSIASGDIFAWLNSDDTYRPGAILEAVNFLREHPEVGMMYGRAYYVDEQGSPVARYPAGLTSYQGLRRGVTTIPQQTMFFRSTLWEMVGPLDPSFFYAMDYDLWVRIASVTHLAFHPVLMANFRLHGDSKSLTQANRCWPEMMRVHFRDGGTKLSVLYMKYLIRRVLEPIMPWRIKIKRILFKVANGSGNKTPERISTH